MGVNIIPVIGWVITLACSASIAIPFWVCWSACGIGRKFFYFIPPVFQVLGFWDTVGLFIVIGTLKLILVPTLASQSVTNEVKK